MTCSGAYPLQFLLRSKRLMLLHILMTTLISSSLLPAEEQELKKVEKAIKLAGTYLISNCRDSGRFVYTRHLSQGQEIGNKYNLLRHAGTMYALSMLAERGNKEKIVPTLKRAAGYLRRFISPAEKVPGSQAVWSEPKEMGRDPLMPVASKLGGNGLSLLALARLEKLSPGTTPLKLLQGLGTTILHMQRKDGSFFAKYYRRWGNDNKFKSLYYPGEAMLGLLTLHDLDPDSKWLNAAALGMAHLAKIRTGLPPADHWALLATEKLLAKYQLMETPPCPKKDVLLHARKICELILSQQNLDEKSEVHGAFLRDARTCPCAIRLEGLLACYKFFDASEKKLLERILTSTKAGISFLIRQQVKEGNMAGAIPRGAVATSSSRRAGEVRVDYVQHALSAMIGYEQLLSEER